MFLIWPIWQLVHHFASEWNIVTNEWIAIKFGTDVFTLQRMKPIDVGDPH